MVEKAQVMIGDWVLGTSSGDQAEHDGLGPEVP